MAKILPVPAENIRPGRKTAEILPAPAERPCIGRKTAEILPVPAENIRPGRKMAKILPAPAERPCIGRKTAEILPAPAEGDGQVLTEREGQILPLIAAGLSSPQIADKIHLSFTTIKWYRKKVLL